MTNTEYRNEKWRLQRALYEVVHNTEFSPDTPKYLLDAREELNSSIGKDHQDAVYCDEQETLLVGCPRWILGS